MYYAYDLTGSDFPLIRTLDIIATQAVTAGQVVKLSTAADATRGTVIPAVVGETGAVIGIAAETHTGTADSLNTRANGTQLRCFVSPHAVYACTAPQYTLTGGSGTTAVIGGIGTFADDDFNGGYIKLISKGASSTITDPVGSVYRVTDFTASTKTFTVASIPGNASAGDIFAIFPPDGLCKGGFSANLQNVDFANAAGTIARFLEADLNKNVIYWTPALQAFSNKQS